MNKKGLAISGILYSMLVLFLVMLIAVLTLLANQKTLMDKTKMQVLNELNGYKEGSDGVGSVDIEAIIKAFMPSGTILNYSGAVAPSGFLLCDGSAVSRTTYAELFAVIGTTYGTGNGTTTFNLPDMRGKVAVGKSSDAEFNTLGKMGGSKTHTLTLSEIPNVTGSIQLHTSENSATNVYSVSGVFKNYVSAPRFDHAGEGISGYTSIAKIGFELGGGGQPHNNLQPYTVVNYMIRY